MAIASFTDCSIASKPSVPAPLRSRCSTVSSCTNSSRSNRSTECSPPFASGSRASKGAEDVRQIGTLPGSLQQVRRPVRQRSPFRGQFEQRLFDAVRNVVRRHRTLQIVQGVVLHHMSIDRLRPTHSNHGTRGTGRAVTLRDRDARGAERRDRAWQTAEIVLAMPHAQTAQSLPLATASRCWRCVILHPIGRHAAPPRLSAHRSPLQQSKS